MEVRYLNLEEKVVINKVIVINSKDRVETTEIKKMISEMMREGIPSTTT